MPPPPPWPRATASLAALERRRARTRREAAPSGEPSCASVRATATSAASALRRPQLKESLPPNPPPAGLELRKRLAKAIRSAQGARAAAALCRYERSSPRADSVALEAVTDEAIDP